MERRLRDTHLFNNRLNPQKSYFKDFSRRFEGITEALTNDEQSETEPKSTKRAGISENAIIKPKRVRMVSGEGGADEDEDDDDEEGAGESGAEGSQGHGQTNSAGGIGGADS